MYIFYREIIMELSKSREVSVLLLMIVLGVSWVVELAMLLMILLKKAFRLLTIKIILCILVSRLISDGLRLSYLVFDQFLHCNFFGGLLNYFELQSVLWILVLSWVVYVTNVNESAVTQLGPSLVITVLSVPILQSVLPLLFSGWTHDPPFNECSLLTDDSVWIDYLIKLVSFDLVFVLATIISVGLFL